MKNLAFAVAILGGAAQATMNQLIVEVDGSDLNTYYQGQQWSTVNEFDAQEGVEIMMNNNIFLKTDQSDTTQSADLHLDLRGGSMTYTVNLSEIECGCVAGAYLVETDNTTCTQNPYDTTVPQCKSIDVFQANAYGFSVDAHPCTGGSCDAISQCRFDMEQHGIAQYGQDSYGPSGTIIDT